MAVSYTHLDVYKRQVAEHATDPAPVGAAVTAGAFGRQAERNTLEAVSYTHLDVYKRQVMA